MSSVDPELESSSRAVREAVVAARSGLVEREILAEVVALSAIAGEHLLVVGPPGTAKSEAVRRVAQQLGGEYFEYLLGRFTEPNEIFGPVDLRRLREGVVEVETSGMLPEADVAFLDEVFLGSTAILNTLLTILNEGTFRRGATMMRCPLRVCVGATNRLPDDPNLAAFADRFLVRVFVDPVPDARLEELLEVGWNGPADLPLDQVSLLPALDLLAASARLCDMSDVQSIIGVAVRRLRAAGVNLSDRRAVRAQRLVAAAAVLDGRRVASADDLWVLPLVAPTADTQVLARDTLGDLLAGARNASLVHAAEEFSRGVEARADRLGETGRELLMGRNGDHLDPDTRLRIEATLREIDAAFTPADLPDRLTAIRDQLTATLQR